MDEERRIKPLSHRTLYDTVGKIRSQGWVFETMIEKFIIMVCVGWSMYSLVNYLFSLVV